MPALTAATLAALPTAAKMAGMSALGSGITQIPSLIPTRTDKANKERLKELERLEEMNMLGLTDREKAAMRNQLGAGAQQAQRRADAEMRRLSAGSPQLGQQLEQAQLAQQGRQDLETRIAQEILNLDLQKQAQQEAELKEVRAAVDSRRNDMIAAGLSPVTGGLEGAIQGMTIQQMFGEGITPEQRSTAISQSTGIPAEEIQKVFPIVNEGLIPQRDISTAMNFDQFKQMQQGQLPGYMTKPISQMTPQEMAMYRMTLPETVQLSPARFNVLGG
jgi:hypothetical protein